MNITKESGKRQGLQLRKPRSKPQAAVKGALKVKAAPRPREALLGWEMEEVSSQQPVLRGYTGNTERSQGRGKSRQCKKDRPLETPRKHVYDHRRPRNLGDGMDSSCPYSPYKVGFHKMLFIWWTKYISEYKIPEGIYSYHGN